MLRPMRLYAPLTPGYSLSQREREIVLSLALAALVAAPAAGIAALRGFDGLYGQDAYAYFDYATASVRDSILHLKPLEAFFWPPGYPLLVALVSLAVGPLPLAGQMVSVVMADTTGLALATLAALALVRYARSGRLGWLILASGGLAYAMLARWLYGL